jgi:hypothetical protein
VHAVVAIESAMSTKYLLGVSIVVATVFQSTRVRFVACSNALRFSRGGVTPVSFHESAPPTAANA